MQKTIILGLACVAAVALTCGPALAGPAITAVPEPQALTLMAGAVGVLIAARFIKRK
jgi:hypothetical protein